MDNDKYIGRLLDNRYEILEVIGSGGMAVVYKARCHRLNRLVAIKILKDDYLEDEDFRRRFHGESQAVAMFSHPNIVNVYDVSSSHDADYIVMELIDGISLKQYMEKKGVLNWKETLHFAIQIAKALEHAHSRGIVHRDIKPHNIMVLKNGSVKVADFGIARMMSKGDTLTKEALGSVHYISPEQAKGGRVDTRSDIYSLGVVMYEMMTGRPPYDGDSPVSVAIKHIDGGAAMPSTLNPSIPGGLEQIIMKAMAHNIDDRYNGATQMLVDMDEFRKSPAMLFDYNTPPIDAVIQFTKPSVHETGPITAAERVVKKTTGAQSKPAGTKPPQRTAPPKRKPAQDSKNDKVATVAIIVCSLLVVCTIVVILWFLVGGSSGGKTSGGPLVQVPHIVGIDSDSISGVDDFEIAWKDTYSDTVPEGYVISVDPAPGTQVSKGAKITITVSRGPAPKEVTMHNLVNMTEDQARNRLESLDMGLVIKIVEEHSSEIVVGNVIRTDPEPSVMLTQGQTVVLYVSKGPESGKMPNLVGMEVNAAKELLNKQNLNLQIEVVEEYDSETPVGQVISSDPKNGDSLKYGDKVTLRVSKGAEMKVMPWVVGSTLESARKSLFDAGFKKAPEIRYVENEKPEGTVIKQSPEAYIQADVNTVVVLEVSSGPKKEVTKNVTLPLGDAAKDADCAVVVKRDGQEVFNATVAAGTESVVIPGQTGIGEILFEIYINGELFKTEKVMFE